MNNSKNVLENNQTPKEKSDFSMKKVFKKKVVIRILAIFLAVVLLTLAGFWFYCRVINRRSFMAGVVDLSLALEHRRVNSNIWTPAMIISRRRRRQIKNRL